MPDQLPLFDTAAAPQRRRRPIPHSTPGSRRCGETASRLSPLVRFGTSSWAFPGWRGLVYAARRTEALAVAGRPAGVRAPPAAPHGRHRPLLLRAHSRRRPASLRRPAARRISLLLQGAGERDLGGRARARVEGGQPALPLGRPVHRRSARAGRRASSASHAGPFVLQFPPMLRRSGLEPTVFIDALDEFLFALPREFRYGVELRDRALLTPAYARVLARHGAGHVYNLWTAMPMPAEQADALPPETMPFVMVRLLAEAGGHLRGAARGVRAVRPDRGAVRADARRGGGDPGAGGCPRHPRLRAGEQQG